MTSVGQWPAFGPVHWLIIAVVVGILITCHGMFDRR